MGKVEFAYENEIGYLVQGVGVILEDNGMYKLEVVESNDLEIGEIICVLKSHTEPMETVDLTHEEIEELTGILAVLLEESEDGTAVMESIYEKLVNLI